MDDAGVLYDAGLRARDVEFKGHWLALGTAVADYDEVVSWVTGFFNDGALGGL